MPAQSGQVCQAGLSRILAAWCAGAGAAAAAAGSGRTLPGRSLTQDRTPTPAAPAHAVAGRGRGQGAGPAALHRGPSAGCEGSRLPAHSDRPDGGS